MLDYQEDDSSDTDLMTEIEDITEDTNYEYDSDSTESCESQLSSDKDDDNIISTQPSSNGQNIRSPQAVASPPTTTPNELSRPENPSPLKRKKSDPTQWKRNTIKRRKVLDILNRSMKVPRCSDKVNHSCCTDFPEDIRKNIYTMFHNLPTITDKRQFLVFHVREEQVGRRTTEGASRRNKTRVYSLTKEREIIKVCREFFLDTLNIPEATLRGALSKLNCEGILMPDMRGKHAPKHKLKEDDEQFIRNHISSFPSVESHYCRKKSEYRYLESALNATKMYELYKLCCIEKGRTAASATVYNRIFRQYKLAFHVPMKDYCKTCSKFEEKKKLGELNEDEKRTYDEHLQKKELARKLKNLWKAEAKHNQEVLAFEFDLQAVLSTPKGAQGPFFYVRKLAVYNLTVYNLGDASVECFVWDETEGKRGSIEISSCIHKYITKFPYVKKVTMFSDSCGGQQKNSNFVRMCLETVKTHPNLNQIEHVFFEPGHSLMECDSIHQKIFQTAKPLPVYTTEEWIQQIRNARRNPAPYGVTLLTHGDFINFDPQKNSSFIQEGRKNQSLPFRKAVRFLYSKDYPGLVQVFTEYDGNCEFYTTSIKRKRGRPSVSEPTKAYNERFPISAAKKKDLMKLCDDLTIPTAYHLFYESLPDSREVREALPEPDINESEPEK